MGDIGSVRRNWNRLGRDDPFWAVLSAPNLRGGRWDVDQFFATGVEEVGRAVERAGELGWTFEHGAALDFGCGVGRLTQALASRFERAVGIDIAPSMIDKARELDVDGRCEFVLHPGDRLPFDDGAFDFVYSRISLQHSPPPVIVATVAEFVRVLADSGLAMFQIPDGPRPLTGLRAALPGPVRDVWATVKARVSAEGRCRMFGVPSAEVQAVVEAAGGRVVNSWPDDSAGPEWPSRFYAVGRAIS